jgi:flagellar motor switch protein FliM
MNIMPCHITTSTTSVNNQQQKWVSLNMCSMWTLRYTEILNSFPSNISWNMFLNFRSYQCKAIHHFTLTSNLPNKKL